MTARPTRVVDAHVHLWDPARTDWYPYLSRPQEGGAGDASRMCRRFDVDTYRAETARWNVEKFVNVAAATGRHSVEETIELDGNAKANGGPDAIIGGIPPTGTVAEAVELLDQQMTASRFRGVRPMGAHQGPLPTASVLRALQERNLVFELMTHPDQLRAAAAKLEGFDDLTVVVEHTGWPRSSSDEEFALWQDGIDALAGLGESITCKLSGLAMPLESMSAGAFAPWLEYAIEAFGVDRCMFASNFPVDSMYGTFDELYAAFSYGHGRPRRGLPRQALCDQRRAHLSLLAGACLERPALGRCLRRNRGRRPLQGGEPELARARPGGPRRAFSASIPSWRKPMNRSGRTARSGHPADPRSIGNRLVDQPIRGSRGRVQRPTTASSITGEPLWATPSERPARETSAAEASRPPRTSSRVSQTVGWLVEGARFSGGGLDKNRTWEVVTWGEVVVVTAYHQIGHPALGAIELGRSDSLMMGRRRIGEHPAHRLVSAPLSRAPLSASGCSRKSSPVAAISSATAPALLLVAVEQNRPVGAFTGQGELPAQVEGILNAGIHPMTFGW